MAGAEAETAPVSQLLRNVDSLVQLMLLMQMRSKHPRRERPQSLGIAGDLSTNTALEYVQRHKFLWVLYADDASIMSRPFQMFELMNVVR